MTLCFGGTFNAAGELNCDNKPTNESLLSAYYKEYVESVVANLGRPNHQPHDSWTRATNVIVALAAQPSIACLGSPPPTPPVTTPPSPPPVPHCSGPVPLDSQTCQALAEYLGLSLGNNGSSFPRMPLHAFASASYSIKGCYAYESSHGGYPNMAAFGMGGSQAQMETLWVKERWQGERYRLMCPPMSDYGYDSSPPSASPSPPFCGFTVFPVEMKAPDAFAKCEALGLQPAKISNAYENAVLLQELRAVGDRDSLTVRSAWLGARELPGTKLEGSFYWIADGTVLDDPKVFRFWDRYPSSCEDRGAQGNDNQYKQCMGSTSEADGDILAFIIPPSQRCDDLPDHRCPTHPTCTCKSLGRGSQLADASVFDCARACAANATRRTPVTYGPRITSFSNWQPDGNRANWNLEGDDAFPGTESYVAFVPASGCGRSSEESPRWAHSSKGLV